MELNYCPNHDEYKKTCQINHDINDEVDTLKKEMKQMKSYMKEQNEVIAKMSRNLNDDGILTL